MPPKEDAMALRKPKERPDSNLSLLIHAIAQAYHRGPAGQPRYQPISFRTGISNAAIHLWKNSAGQNVRPDYLRKLADVYHLDFAKVIEFVFGPPTKLHDDALLAALRPDGGDDNGGSRSRRLRPIGGGSDGPPSPHVVETLEMLSLIRRTWLRLFRFWARPLLPTWCSV